MNSEKIIAETSYEGALISLWVIALSFTCVLIPIDTDADSTQPSYLFVKGSRVAVSIQLDIGCSH